LGQFVAMLFCQLGGAKSLREICGGLAASEGKLKHLGVPQAPSRSTLAYANEHRPWQLYEELFDRLLGKCQQVTANRSAGRSKFRFKNKLLSMDASVIDLCASVFDWAQFRKTKGAVKLHLLLDHDGYLPSFAVITEGKQHESKVAKLQRFTPGTVLVFDRGYNDYDWFGELSDQGVFFVTRMKDNAKYIVLQERVIPRRKGLIKDQIICFLNEAQAQEAQQQLAHRYRRIEFYDEAHDRVLFFVTNHMSLAAATVAEVYKQRWQIELFFKALKQSLRVKTFVGTSANALKIQIWSALIAMLMIKYLQLRSTFGWSLSNLVALLRQQLFVYRHLWTWIDDPFQPPNAIAEISPQMDLAF
jgi:hypothetical protein